jgi:hypothetical protein
MQFDTSWFPGFLAGVGATLVGFLLTMAWDWYKWRRDSKKQQEAMFSAAVGEIKNNLRILKRNGELISQELSILAQGQIILNPLGLMNTGAWDLMKIHHPTFLIENDLLSHVNSAAQLAEEINGIVRNRELYHQNNGAMSNYRDRMQKYDYLLSEQNNKLLLALTALEEKVGKFIKE